MKPGLTIRFSALIVFLAVPGQFPTSTIKPFATPTSAFLAGAPVPSTTVPPRMTTSYSMAPRIGPPMDRRHLFRISAAAGLALGLLKARAAAPGPAMRALSEYMAAAAKSPLPRDVTEPAKHHLLDTLASMVSGSELPPGLAGARYVQASGGKGLAT